MPRSPEKTLIDKVKRSKASLERIDQMRRDALYRARADMLKAYEYGISRTALAKLWSCNPSRMAELLAQAESER